MTDIRISILAAMVAAQLLSEHRLLSQIPCDAVPGNHLENCGFELGQPPVDWTLVAGQDFVRSPSPRTGSYSGDILPESAVIGLHGAFILASACFAAAGPGAYEFGAHFLHPSAFPSLCRVTLQSFDDEDCLTLVAESDSTYIPLVPGAWTPVTSMAEPADSFIRLDFHCYSDPWVDTRFLVDDAFAIREAPIVEVPAVSQQGLLALLALLATAGALAVRRTRRRSY